MFWRGTILAAILCVRLIPACAGPVIREGDVWRYLKGTNTPDAAWTTLAYDDSSWLGPAPSGFGYGDGDDATVLGDMQNSYVSVFTRRLFVISATADVSRLTLALDFDDGLVAYLNGQEVARRTMAPGLVTSSTTATGNHEASRSGQSEYAWNLGQNEKEFVALDPGLLVDGTNVLAVSGHNISVGSTDFSLIVELYTNVTLVRGPILQMPCAGRMTVTWQTDGWTDGVVDYGLGAGYELGSVSNAGPGRQHAVDLPVLPAGSTCFYRVRSAGVTLAESAFRAPAAAGQRFRFAVIGDFGSTAPSTKQVAAQVAAKNPDLHLTVGDNVYYTGQPGSFEEQWLRPYSNAVSRSPVFPVLGNHDIRAATGQFTIANFFLPTNGPPGLEERNFSFDYGNAHFVGFDSNPLDLNQPSDIAAIKTWLSNDLAQTTQPWKFVFYHHPPYTSKSNHDDQESVKTNISPILEKYGVRLAFQGHNHLYERINPVGGVNYITTGGGGINLYGVSVRKAYSASLFNSAYSFVYVDVDGDELALRCVDQYGVERDAYALDLGHPFLMDGLVDDASWWRATNALGTIKLYAAIRGTTLYVAGQDAPIGNGADWFGNDHFIYVNHMLTTQRTANWAKSGLVMDWSAYLADESTGGFHAWFDRDESIMTNRAICRSITTGINNNGAAGNGVMEGTLNLPGHFGFFPTNLALAFGPFSTTNDGVLLPDYQMPPGNGSANISSGEVLWISARDLALDLPVADAGPDGAVEAGMAAVLDGSGSSAPSGLPLSFLWSHVDGPPAAMDSPLLPVTALRVTNNLDAASNVVVRLTVHDTRFDSADTLVVTVYPMVDSDGDGLSDQEETTGFDNLLTSADPAGLTSRVDVADTDADGLDDGREAIAGTDPGDALSALRVLSPDLSPPEDLVIRWPSASNRAYAIHAATSLVASDTGALATNLAATPPFNAHTVAVEHAEQQFYFIEVEP